MKKALIVLAVFATVLSTKTFAQQAGQEAFKIVFQLTTDDTLAHKALMKQLSNITSVEPQTKIEVVCHGPGLNMLHKERTIVAAKVSEFSAKGIVFNACEFSMKERNVSKEQILSDASYVKAGILYIVKKQSEGWYYIKSGF